jgi:quinol monooxygenase YgiN
MSDTPVTVLASIKVKAGMEDRARELLLSIVAPTRDEPGCLNYDLHQSTTEPTEFMFYERWTSDEALAAHSASTAPHRAALREHLGPLVAGAPSVTRWRAV